jgi:hypothetical protein
VTVTCEGFDRSYRAHTGSDARVAAERVPGGVTGRDGDLPGRW